MTKHEVKSEPLLPQHRPKDRRTRRRQLGASSHGPSQHEINLARPRRTRNPYRCRSEDHPLRRHHRDLYPDSRRIHTRSKEMTNRSKEKNLSSSKETDKTPTASFTNCVSTSS